MCRQGASAMLGSVNAAQPKKAAHSTTWFRNGRSHMDDTNDTGQRNAYLSRRALTKLAIAIGAAGASSAIMSSGAAAQAGGTRMLLATTTIEDFDHWIKAFGTTSLVKRKKHGSTGATVFRDPSDKNRVWVMFEWDDKGWQSFVADPEVPAIMKEAGHTSKAQVAVQSGRFEA
jgi:hypothetical protein